MKSKLFLLLFLGIVLMGIASAASDVLELSGESSNIGGITAAYGVEIQPSADNLELVAERYASTNANTAELWVKTGTTSAVSLRNATFDGVGNATFAKGSDFNSTYVYFITVQNLDGSAYTVGENGSASGHYPRSNTQLTASASIRIGISRYTDQAEAYNKFYTTTGTFSTAPTITLLNPTDAQAFLTDTITFATLPYDVDNATDLNVTIYWNYTGSWGIMSYNSTAFNNTQTNFTVLGLAEGLYLWNARVFDGTSYTWGATNRTFTVSQVAFLNQEFTPSLFEQTSTTFKQNFTLASGLSVSLIKFTYNQTNYSASFSAINATSYQATAIITTPSVSSTINKTFNWTVGTTDGTYHRSTSSQQEVVDFNIDNCSVNMVQLFNFTMVNESTGESINNVTENSTIRIDLSLYPNGSLTTTSLTYSHLYTKVLPARVCINSSLASTVFYANMQVQYDADGFASEFYNIQNYSLNASSNPSENITLYDLMDSQSQVFTISYKDSTFLPVQNALIQIQRKYLDEGIFKVVEIPMTDISGEALGHLILNDVIYSFTVVKNGQVLATFDNVYAKCQNPTLNTCTIDLNAFSSSITITNFETTNDFAYTLAYDNATRTISTTFSIPSGAVSWVSLNVTSEDALGTEACNQSVTTSAGTLSCVVPSTFGNATVMASIYKDGTLIARGQIKLSKTPAQIYGGILIMLGVFIMLTLIGAGVSDSPVITLIFFMIGVILLFSLNLVANNGFIGVTATVLWLIIAIILVLIKASKRS